MSHTTHSLYILREEKFKKSVRTARYRAHLEKVAPRFDTSFENQDFTFWLESKQFFDLLEESQGLMSRIRAEVGMTFSVNRKAMSPPSWGKLVLGSQKKIALSDDPDFDYFSHLKGCLPLVSLHFHPSGRLGLSREDCLTANVILNETKSYLTPNDCYRPIFAVGILKKEQTIEILYVQRRKPGKFIEFQDLGQSYSVSSFLACPEFNVALVEYQKENEIWVSNVKNDTGIIPALS